MVAYTFYEQDNRVRRYAEALVKRGDQVDVLALQREGLPAVSVFEGVRVFRIQRRRIDEKGKLSYLMKLLLFFLRSLAVLARLQWKEHYDVIHIHSVPDFEVFAALVPKLMGAKIILDIHDIVPEFYASKFKVSKRSLAFKLLVLVERVSIAFSDHVIAANHIWLDRLRQRSVSPSKSTVVLNYPDGSIFYPRGKRRQDGKFIMIYPGTLNHHQGVDISIRAFALIKDQVPQAEFHIYGSGNQVEFLRHLSADLGLEGRVFFEGSIPLQEIPIVIENADLGVVPKRGDGFGDEAFSTKILEFMAMGLPAIIPSTTIDRYYFNDSVVRFFKPNDVASLAEAMLGLIKSPDEIRRLASNAGEFVKEFSWERNSSVYFSMVDSLVSAKGSGGR